MVFKVLDDGRIWIQFILVSESLEEKSNYSNILPKYGTYSYIEADIIEFISDLPDQKPNAHKARQYVENLNDKLNISLLIEA